MKLESSLPAFRRQQEATKIPRKIGLLPACSFYALLQSVDSALSLFPLSWREFFRSSVGGRKCLFLSVLLLGSERFPVKGSGGPLVVSKRERHFMRKTHLLRIPQQFHVCILLFTICLRMLFASVGQQVSTPVFGAANCMWTRRNWISDKLARLLEIIPA